MEHRVFVVSASGCEPLLSRNLPGQNKRAERRQQCAGDWRNATGGTSFRSHSLSFESWCSNTSTQGTACPFPNYCLIFPAGLRCAVKLPTAHCAYLVFFFCLWYFCLWKCEQKMHERWNNSGQSKVIRVYNETFISLFVLSCIGICI